MSKKRARGGEWCVKLVRSKGKGLTDGRERFLEIPRELGEIRSSLIGLPVMTCISWVSSLLC